MFPQDTPPDTAGYMIAGYAVFLIISAIYLISLVVRSHNLKQDLATLESLQAESPASPAPQVETTGPKRKSPRPAKAKASKKKAVRRR